MTRGYTRMRQTGLNPNKLIKQRKAIRRRRRSLRGTRQRNRENHETPPLFSKEMEVPTPNLTKRKAQDKKTVT